jgi:predicted nuclease of predicted toxin-antitoxin system
VLYVAEQEPGITDDDVLNLANQGNSLLLTADKDFGELIFRQGKIKFCMVGQMLKPE